MAHYLTRSRHGTAFYVRVVVPTALRSLIGRTELRRSLGEIPLKLARLRAAERAHRLTLAFDALRTMAAAKKLPTIGLAIAYMVRSLDGTTTEQRIEVDPDNPKDIAAYKEIFGSGLGMPPPRVPSTAPRAFEEVCALFVTEHMKAGAWTEKTRQEVESVLRRYEVHCQAKKLDVYCKEAATSFKTERLLPELTPRTVNKHVSRLASFFGWAKRNGYAPDNVFDGLTVRRAKPGKASDDRDAYSEAEVHALLASLDCAAEPRCWLPLLGLYTGARINELAQLHLDDVRIDSESAVHYIDINAAGTPATGKRLKNAQSERVVPLHSDLLARGFLAHVDSLRRAGAKRLFEKFPLGRDGYGQAASRWFQRHRQKHELGPDFHGLRHTVATALREAGVAQDVVAELLGHEFGSTMSFSRYAKASSLIKLREAVEKLSFHRNPRC